MAVLSSHSVQPVFSESTEEENPTEAHNAVWLLRVIHPGFMYALASQIKWINLFIPFWRSGRKAIFHRSIFTLRLRKKTTPAADTGEISSLTAHSGSQSGPRKEVPSLRWRGCAQHPWRCNSSPRPRGLLYIIIVLNGGSDESRSQRKMALCTVRMVGVIGNIVFVLFVSVPLSIVSKTRRSGLVFSKKKEKGNIVQLRFRTVSSFLLCSLNRAKGLVCYFIWRVLFFKSANRQVVKSRDRFIGCINVLNWVISLISLNVKCEVGCQRSTGYMVSLFYWSHIK